jgi:hypothetical protein
MTAAGTATGKPAANKKGIPALLYRLAVIAATKLSAAILNNQWLARKAKA